MITFFCTHSGRRTFGLTTSRAARRMGFPPIRVLHYENAPRLQEIEGPICVFADLERLNATTSRYAREAAIALSARCRVLNDPARAMTRYELLRLLFERSINVTRIYRLEEARSPTAFPVFLRMEEHGSILTDLLHSEEELEAAKRRIFERHDLLRKDVLICEFLDTSVDGWFRTYSAYIVGDQIIPGTIAIERKWEVRDATPKPPPGYDHDLLSFITENPHASRLKEVARIAGLEYGRVDYSVRDGRIQVWEINTNPGLPAPTNCPELASALANLEHASAKENQ